MNERTEQAHKDMRNVLLASRILLNGMPLTGNELGALIQEEQMLYEKASRLDAAQELAAKQAKPKVPGKKEAKIIPIDKPKEK